MSGVHALLRAPLDTVRSDARLGRHTAGIVCGYRGSPLGTVDTTFAAHEAEFTAHDIRFVNGVNEDLAATVLWGSQRVAAGTHLHRRRRGRALVREGTRARPVG